MLGPRIAALRRGMDMSQAELARRLQISASAVGMYEQERREPSVNILVALARVFGVSTDYLLTGQPVENRDEEALGRILARSMEAAETRMRGRRERPFSHQELAVLFAAMLTEP